MLCLSARPVSCGGETIVLKTAHGDISLVIADIDGGRVRIGIHAPADVKIVRVKQVINKLKQEVVT